MGCQKNLWRCRKKQSSLCPLTLTLVIFLKGSIESPMLYVFHLPDKELLRIQIGSISQIVSKFSYLEFNEAYSGLSNYHNYGK